MGDRRSVGVRLGCDLHHVVGDASGARHGAVVTAAESKSVPLVVRSVDVVVTGGTAWAAGGGAQEVRPSVGTRADHVLAGAGVAGVPVVACEFARDVAWDDIAVGVGVAVAGHAGSAASARERLVDVVFVTDTDHGKLVAVPEEDQVHAGAVVSGDAEESTVVVVEVHLAGAGAAGVVGGGRGVGRGLPLDNPVVVEVVAVEEL